MKFEDKRISVRTAINIVKASVFLTGSISKNSMYADAEEFRILKMLGISGHPSKAPIIIRVNWFPPTYG